MDTIDCVTIEHNGILVGVIAASRRESVAAIGKKAPACITVYRIEHGVTSVALLMPGYWIPGHVMREAWATWYGAVEEAA